MGSRLVMNTPCRVMADLDQHMHMLERNEKREAAIRRDNPLRDFEREAVADMLSDGLASYLTAEEIAAKDRLALYAACPGLMPHTYGMDGMERDEVTLAAAVRPQVLEGCHRYQDLAVEKELGR